LFLRRFKDIYCVVQWVVRFFFFFRLFDTILVFRYVLLVKRNLLRYLLDVKVRNYICLRDRLKTRRVMSDRAPAFNGRLKDVGIIVRASLPTDIHR